MLARNVAWGIDIGHCSVKAVKLVKAKGGVEVADFEIIPFQKSLPKSGQEADDAIREVLREFVLKHKPKSEAVAVSMPGHAAFYRPISLPAVEKKKVSQLVQFEARQMIPFPLEEVVWDYQALGEAGLGEEMEVGLFAMKKDVVHSFLANLRACTLEVDVVQIAPLAAYNFLRHEKPAISALIALDVGAENTDLIVSDGQKLWLRNLHVAGNNFTRALQKKFRISMKEAEQLKESISSPDKRDSEQGKKVFGVIQPILSDLVSEIQRSIGFYKSQAVDVQFDSILVLGNAFRSEAQLESLSSSLGYHMERVNSLEVIQVSSRVDAERFLSEAASFGVAIGLALQGLGLSAMTINLLPQEFLAKKRVDVKKPFALAAAASVLLGLSLSYGTSLFTAKDCGQLADEVYDRTKIYKDHDEEFSAADREVRDDSDIYRDLRDMTTCGVNRNVWISILRVLDRIVPQDNIWLRKLATGPITSSAEAAEHPKQTAPGGEHFGPMPGPPPGAHPEGPFGPPPPGAPGEAPKPQPQAPEPPPQGAREQIVVTLTGACRDNLGITYVGDNLLSYLGELPFTEKDRTKIDTYAPFATLIKEGRAPTGTEMEVLEFSMVWVIDVERFLEARDSGALDQLIEKIAARGQGNK